VYIYIYIYIERERERERERESAGRKVHYSMAQCNWSFMLLKQKCRKDPALVFF
jgi:hypothetical protein